MAPLPPAPAAAEAAVGNAYAGLRPFYSDLLDDLGATDCFVVDGVALLLDLLGSERLDWAHGGQFLQLRAGVEAFVAGVQAANTAGLRWHVAWFDASAALLPGGGAAAARALAAAWLEALRVPALRFPSWWHPDWAAWLAAARPAMLLLTDLPGSSAGGGARAAGGEAWEQRRLFLHAQVAHTQAAGIQCAFLSELRFMAEGAMHAFRTGWRPAAAAAGARAGAALAITAAAAAVGTALAAQAVPRLDGRAGLDAPSLLQLAASQAEQLGGARAALGAVCCGAAVALAPPAVPASARRLFARAWCLHELLLRRLALPDRARRLPEALAAAAGNGQLQEAQRGLHACLDTFHAAAAALLSSAGTSTSPSASALASCPSLADWLDGRLLHVVAFSIGAGQAPPLLLAPEELAELQVLSRLAQAAAAAVGGASCDLAQLDAAAAELSLAPPATAAEPAARAGPATLAEPSEPAGPAGPAAQRQAEESPEDSPSGQPPPFSSNELVQAICGPSAGSGGAGLPLGSQLAVSLAPYKADYHWHTGVPIDAAQLEVAQVEAEPSRAELEALSLKDMAASATLPSFIRRCAAKAVQQVEVLMKAGDRRDAASQEEQAKQRIVAKAKGSDGRAWQMFYRHQEKYAKSLDASRFSRPPPRGGHGGKGKGGRPGPAGQGGAVRAGGGGRSGAPLSKAEQIKAANAERLAAKHGSSAEEQWGTMRARLEASAAAEGWTRQVAAKAAGVLGDLAGKSAAVYLAAATWRVQQLCNAWDAAAWQQRSGGAGAGDAPQLTPAAAPLAVELWAAVADIAQRGLFAGGGSGGAPDEARQEAAAECQRGLRLLGLAATAEHVAGLAQAGSSSGSKKKGGGGGKKASGRGGGEGGAGGAGLGLTDARFQLRHCGPLLPHEAPPESDPRVASFNPDPWQRQVLDAIDGGASALIVAPTSSGKTFISAYCCASVVQRAEDPEGVVVFVAPTKALVNQVAAQLYKNFEGLGASTGVFTRDYRHNVEGCRILVTVPACLEILLLSPTSQAWVRRIRYAILDEVHCLREVHLGEGGVRDGAGATWEHILLLLRCPFLALSATIGNPVEFAGWLRGVKALQGEQDAAAGRAPAWRGPRHHDMLLIQHSTRHSDLRLHTYRPRAVDAAAGDGGLPAWSPPVSSRVASLEGAEPRPARRGGGSGEAGGLEDSGSLVRMNPLAVLEAEDLAQARAGLGCFPPEMGLEPADVEQLHDAMAAAAAAAPEGPWRAQALERLAALAPEPFFAALGTSAGRGPFLSRQQVRQYEAELKQLLLSWAASDGGGRSATAAVLAAIRAAQYQAPPEHTATLADGAAMVGLALDLLRRGMLPAIAFSFERRVCHHLLEAAVEHLEACEAEERRVNAAKYEALEAEAAKKEAAAKAARDRKPDARRGGEEREEDAGAAGGFDPDAPLPEFSLAGRPRALSTEEVAALIRDAASAGGMDPLDGALVRGLRRGLGIHHGGLPKVYRQCVEILFRAGHLRLIIATGTLAFGINMPCKTVVFAGDHLFLNALQFRQMMGRAGRRGFDPLGNVVFFGVGPRKIRSLMVSPVPRLRGHFPLNLTTVLRALALHHIASAGGGAAAVRGLVGGRRAGGKGGGGGDGGTAAEVRDSLVMLFSRPFFAEGQRGLLQQVRHLFGFALEHLAGAGAVGPQGEPLGLAGLLCHLHWTDPANLALASLLRWRALDGICSRVSEGMSDAAWAPIAEQLLLVVSHLFQRLPLHRAMLEQPERFLYSPSKVVLEPLPPAVQAAVDRHNGEALRELVAYVRRYVAGLSPDGGAAERAAEPLPLSGLAVPVAPGAAAPPASACLLGLLAPAPRVEAAVCSPYAALSGRGDVFSSADDLVRSCRAGMLLDIASAPVVGMQDRHGRAVPLNRYALDFFQHGQKAALVDANGLREGDAWQALSAVCDILRVVAVALGRLLPPGSFHPVAHSMERLAREFAERFAAFNASAPGRRSGY